MKDILYDLQNQKVEDWRNFFSKVLGNRYYYFVGSLIFLLSRESISFSQDGFGVIYLVFLFVSFFDWF